MAVIAVAAAGVTSLAACGSSSGSNTLTGSSVAAADANATLTYGAYAPLVTFDPATSQAGGDPSVFLSLVYDYLVQQDVKGVMQPDLATSWKQNSPTEWTFTLRKGVTFQDGSAFNATAAAESIERSIKANGPRESSLAPIASLKAVSPTTLQINLKTPDPDLLLTLDSPPGAILSPKAFGRGKALALDPDGTGPYLYDASKSVPGDHYTFTVNPKWWGGATVPRPHTVVMAVLTDATARLNALKTGQVDIATITAQEASEAVKSGLKLTTRPNNWSGMMILDRQGKTVPALGSRDVREAIALALNRKSLVTALAYGYAVPSDQVFGKGDQGYDPSLESKYAYNLQKAKQLIAESGFKNITFTAPIAAVSETSAEAVKSELAAVGITMNLQVEQPNALGPLARSKKYPVLTFGLPNNDPLSRYEALWAPNAGFNPFHVDDPVLDKLAQEYASAPTTTAANKYAAEMNDEVINQGIAIVASQPDDIAAYSPKLKGVYMSTYISPRILGIYF